MQGDFSTIGAGAQSVQVFNHPMFGDLRVVERDGDPWFVSKDVCDGLDIDRTATRRLDEDEKGVHSIHTPGGEQSLSIVSFPGLLSLILGSRKKEAREYKRWVTHEVLPSVHKNGGYIAGQNQMDDAELMARALLVSQKVIDAKQALIDQMHPKALFADAVAASDSTILIGDLAKIIKQSCGVDTGQKRLFAWMRENGWLMKDGSSKNMPTQRAMDMGLFRVKETTISNPDGSVRVTKTTKVTGKGQQFFVNKFAEAGEVAAS